MGVGRHVFNGHIAGPAQKCSEGKFCYAGPVIIVVVGTLTMGPQVTGEIQGGMEIGDRPAGIIANQMTPTGFGGGIQGLGQVDDSQSVQLVYDVHKRVSSNV